MAAEPPISFRPETAQRRLIDALARDGLSATEVIKRGLDLMRELHEPARQPLHARSISDADVDVAIEEAASAACERLDELFKGQGSPEVRGISSNFQGLLAQHLRAMLTGRSHDYSLGRTRLNPLLARADSFGRPVIPGPGQGVTFLRPAQRVGEADLYYSEGRFVPLKDIDVGGLFTSSAAAIKDYLAFLRQENESPQERPAYLVLIDIDKHPQEPDALKESPVKQKQLTALQLEQVAKAPRGCREDMEHYLSSGAQVTIEHQNEVGEAKPYAVQVVGTDYWIDCYASAAEAAEAAKALGLEVVS